MLSMSWHAKILQNEPIPKAQPDPFQLFALEASSDNYDEPDSMKELAKSMISLSLAAGLVSARGVASMFDRDRRGKFLHDSEELLRKATAATVETLGRDWRQTFRFGDQLQRRVIDAATDARFARRGDAARFGTCKRTPSDDTGEDR
jgi:hypothetical protein